MSGLVTTTGFSKDTLVNLIVSKWDQWWNAQQKLREYDKEVLEYLHSSTTENTSNHIGDEGHGHTTNIPMLYKTKETLIALYMDMIFPSSQYIKWEQKGEMDESARKKGAAAAAYMREKLEYVKNAKAKRQLIDDFVTFGRVASFTDFERIVYPTPEGSSRTHYEGPIVERLHPYDYVFDITARDINQAPKMIRQVYNISDLVKMSENGSSLYTPEIVNNIKSRRMNTGTVEAFSETQKHRMMPMQGYGTYGSYLESGQVEVLCYLGDLYDIESHTLKSDRHILVIDRSEIVYDEPTTFVTGDSFFYHVYEPYDNTLAGIGPLHKVVGLQYSMNHVQNMKANALDLEIKPPLAFTGGDPTQEWEPGAKFILDTEENVQPLNVQTNALALNNEVSMIMNLYEQVSGVPREVSGFRTQGEKTMFEVENILSGGQRIPMRKAKEFEQFFWEPVLSSMLEHARNGRFDADWVKVMGEQTGVDEFVKIVPSDLPPAGSLKPIGARGISEEARALREFVQLMGPNFVPTVLQPHISGKALTNIIEKSLNYENKGVFRQFAQLAEQAELQQHAAVANQHAQETALTSEDQSTPTSDEPAPI